jgi:hypothetical protein
MHVEELEITRNIMVEFCYSVEVFVETLSIVVVAV